jgi:2-haloacid dehalogenase
MDLDRFEVVTFDCFGTLIDWENGIRGCLRGLLSAHGVTAGDREVLELYARLEAEAEGGPYVAYRTVLERVTEGVGRAFGFTPSPAEKRLLAESLGQWPPLPDTVEALRALGTRYRLGILSNIDVELFAQTERILRTEFEWTITAECGGAYKPSLRVFEIAEDRIGVSRKRWLHVAQSIYHDIAPASAFGLATVWVNRRAGRQGWGATPAGDARPDLEVPGLSALVDMAGLP